MGFDETCDAMLRQEFGSYDTGTTDHAAVPAPPLQPAPLTTAAFDPTPPVSPSPPPAPPPLVAPIPLAAPVVRVALAAPVVPVAPASPMPPAAFLWPEDQTSVAKVAVTGAELSVIHEEFSPHVPVAASEEAPTQSEGPRGLSRYRNAAMVGAGGLACAAVGSFLGGLGGYFTIDPAAAHPVVSASGPEQQLANAINQAHGLGAGRPANDALGTATLASLTGSLTQGISPFRWLTASGSGFLSAFPMPASLASLSGAGSGAGSGSGTGTDPGCSANELGLDCILTGVSSTLGDIGSIPSDPTGALGGSLSGVVVDLTGTLSDLGGLAPTGSLPPGVLPISGLGGLSGLGSLSGLSGLSSLTGLGNLTGLFPGVGALTGSGAAGSRPGSGAGLLDPVLNGVVTALGGVTGSGSGSGSASGPGSASLPTLPTVPVTVPSGSVTTTTTTPTTTTTTTPSNGGTTTTVTVPLPSLPLPSTPPVTVGGVSVGVNSGGSGSGLSLSLP